jgi:hypothetical protein
MKMPKQLETLLRAEPTEEKNFGESFEEPHFIARFYCAGCRMTGKTKFMASSIIVSCCSDANSETDA